MSHTKTTDSAIDSVLQAKIDELTDQLADVTNKNLILNQQVEAGNDLQAKVEEITAKLAEAEAERDQALEEVESLSKKLDLQETVKDLPGILVEIHGEPHMLIGKKFLTKDANGNPVELTADQAASDQEWLERMHAKGSGSLVPADQFTDGLTE